MTKAILWLTAIQVAVLILVLWTCGCDMHVYDPALLEEATFNVEIGRCGDEDGGYPELTVAVTDAGVVWAVE